MSFRARTLLASILAGGLGGELAVTAWADCVDTPLTITFDAGAGTPHCYSESVMTVCASRGVPPNAVDDTLTLGDNDGDTSPDLMNRGIDNEELVYTFSMGGAPFAVTSFDFVNDPANGRGTFTPFKPGSSSCCNDFDQYDTGVVTPDPEGWSGITSFTWTTYELEPGPQVMDNLSIVAQCCGNGVVDPGEQCDDGNTVGNDEDGNCCSATCQFEASGTYCTGDALFCTVDVCNGTGTCTSNPIPNCDVTRPCGPTRPPGNPAFEHPKSAGPLKTSLVQAFVVCADVGGNSPDRTTEGGIPACMTETPNERAGSPPNGWHWDESRGRGDIQIKTICSGAADFEVKLKLTGVIDGSTAPASADGALALTLRATVNDPVGGDMTTVDLAGQLPVTVLNGNGALKTTVGVMLSDQGLSDLPNGTSLEVIDVQVLDPNGYLFAHPGLLLLQ